MSTDTASSLSLNRRAFITASGALIVGLSNLPREADAAPATSSTKPPLRPDQLDSYIAIEADGNVVVFYGRIDGGQGLNTLRFVITTPKQINSSMMGRVCRLVDGLSDNTDRARMYW